jgi:hypothetical protein
MSLKEFCLEQAIKSFTDLPQPINADGYTDAFHNVAPATYDILLRANAFTEWMLNGKLPELPKDDEDAE